MSVFKHAVVGSMILVLAAPFCIGCGEPEYSQPEEDRLGIAGLYPQDGDTNVPLNMTAIVVFDDPVTFASGAANVNGSTFYLEKDGGSIVSTATVEKSDLDTQEATALLVLPDPSPLESGAKYYVVVEGTIKGKNTDPLGTQVRNWFTVQ